MSCIPEDLLHRLVEGELPAGERPMVDEHLAACDGCRERRLELSELRALMAAPPEAPFDDADFVSARRSVLAAIERQGASRPFFTVFLRAAAAGLAVAALGLLVGLWHRPVRPPVAVVRPTAVPTAVPEPAAAEPSGAPAAKDQAIGSSAFATLDPARAVAAKASRRRTRGAEAAPAARTPMRIEIQTGNPAIRIIWLVNAETTTNTSPIEGS